MKDRIYQLRIFDGNTLMWTCITISWDRFKSYIGPAAEKYAGYRYELSVDGEIIFEGILKEFQRTI